MTALAMLLLDPGYKLVRIVSWHPWWGPHGLEWPTMLVDNRIGQRQKVTPVWDHAMIIYLCEKLRHGLR